MKLRPILYGCATCVPGIERYFRKGTGGTDSARYCYAVWMRHWITAVEAGVQNEMKVVAELGPGDSLGIGLAALLAGADQYFGLDVLPYAAQEKNQAILEELIQLFRDRVPIPDDTEFPELMPRLADYRFPDVLLSSEAMECNLRADRLAQIRGELKHPGASDNQMIRYAAPWFNAAHLKSASIDWVFSQAVLEHVDALDSTYSALWESLKAGGIMSHVIDYRSHGITEAWDGHWGYGETIWKVVRGRRPYLINRCAHSRQMALHAAHGFEIVKEIPEQRVPELTRAQLAAPFSKMTDTDRRTALATVISRKPEKQ